MTLTTSQKIEKNKLLSKGRFILLLEISYDPDEDSLYLCRNTENIVWNGITWRAFPFRFEDTKETKENENPSTKMMVADIFRDLTPYLDNYAGGVGTKVIARQINTNFLSELTPWSEDEYDITDVKVDHTNTIEFTIGSENLSIYRSPRNRFLKSHCRYGVFEGGFKGSHCKYSGVETECNRSYTRCKELGNQINFGGQPGVGQRGLFK